GPVAYIRNANALPQVLIEGLKLFRSGRRCAAHRTRNCRLHRRRTLSSDSKPLRTRMDRGNTVMVLAIQFWAAVRGPFDGNSAQGLPYRARRSRGRPWAVDAGYLSSIPADEGRRQVGLAATDHRVGAPQ